MGGLDSKSWVLSTSEDGEPGGSRMGTRGATRLAGGDEAAGEGQAVAVVMEAVRDCNEASRIQEETNNSRQEGTMNRREKGRKQATHEQGQTDTEGCLVDR